MARGAFSGSRRLHHHRVFGTLTLQGRHAYVRTRLAKTRQVRRRVWSRPELGSLTSESPIVGRATHK
jgi:hypothetical protein